jgi:hypothetical protein
MINTIRAILEITKEVDLKNGFGEFEDEINASLHPLINLLGQDVRSTEVTSILDHMTGVEKWRERCVRYLSLATAFHGHAKSDHFIVAKIKGQTEFDRAAYQKKLTCAFQGLEVYLDGLISSLDSRVNICKKLLGLEDGGNFKLKG